MTAPVTSRVQAVPELARSARAALLTRWWAWPVLVFLLTRAIDAVMIVVAARHQVALDHAANSYHVTRASPASPGYLDVAVNWDAQWYWLIAQHGYPHSLPMHDGAVAQNEWAFAPLFPLLSRIGMTVTGAGFPVVATTLATVLSLAGVMAVFRLMEETAGPFSARAVTLLLCTSMAAPVLQIAYTEGAALLLISLALLFLRRRRHGWTVLTLLALGLTRHVVAPFLVVLLAVAVVDRRREGRWNRGSLMTLAAGVAVTGLWPAWAAARTGRLTAFTDTQAAWRLEGGTGAFGLYSVSWATYGWVGLTIMVCASAVVLWLVLRRGSPSWGVEVRTWTATYPLYLFAVAPVATSIFRLMLLAFPLLWVLPERRPVPWAHRATLVVLAVTGLCLQWYWIRYFLVIGPLDEHFAMP